MKKGQMKISFSMIFSILLVVLLLALAFYGIRYFMDFSDSAQTAKSVHKFSEDVKGVWQASMASEEVNYTFPDGIKYFCYVEQDSEIKGDFESLFDEVSSFLDPEDNSFVYSSEENHETSKIDYLDVSSLTSDNNPNCFEIDEGRLSLIIKKDFQGSGVEISSLSEKGRLDDESESDLDEDNQGSSDVDNLEINFDKYIATVFDKNGTYYIYDSKEGEFTKSGLLSELEGWEGDNAPSEEIYEELTFGWSYSVFEIEDSEISGEDNSEEENPESELDGPHDYYKYCGDGLFDCDGDGECECYSSICGGDICYNGKCCSPKTCSNIGKECGGPYDDGCGKELWCEQDCDYNRDGKNDCNSKRDGCFVGEICRNGRCECVPDCEDKVCGDDGCGGSCGNCYDEEGDLAWEYTYDLGCLDDNSGYKTQRKFRTYTGECNSEEGICAQSNQKSDTEEIVSCGKNSECISTPMGSMCK